MQSIKIKVLLVMLAAVTTVLVVPIATAGASKIASSSAKKGAVAKQIKALKKQSRALAEQAALLAKQNALLAGQVSTLEAKTTALERRKFPTSLPPSGTAGGALTGTYPNPSIAPIGSASIADGAVQSADLADGGILSADLADGAIQGVDILDGTIQSADILDGAVQSTDIADGAVQSADLGDQSVGGRNLKSGIFEETSMGVPVGAGQTKEASVTCPGTARLLGGGFEWGINQGNGASIISSGPNVSSPQNSWGVQGRVDGGAGGGTPNTLFAVALCLAF